MRKQYLKSLLLTFFFAIATVSTALHELSPHHHADNCPVCVADEHSLSADIIASATEEETLLFCDQYSFTAQQRPQKLSTDLNARAPPQLLS